MTEIWETRDTNGKYKVAKTTGAKPSGAYKDRGDELRCRTCGQSCDIEDGKLSCPAGHFSEEYQ